MDTLNTVTIVCLMFGSNVLAKAKGSIPAKLAIAVPRFTLMAPNLLTCDICSTTYLKHDHRLHSLPHRPTYTSIDIYTYQL